MSRRGSDVAIGAGRVEEISSADGLWHLSAAIRCKGLLVIGAAVHICSVSAVRLIEPVLACVLCSSRKPGKQAKESNEQAR